VFFRCRFSRGKKGRKRRISARGGVRRGISSYIFKQRVITCVPPLFSTYFFYAKDFFFISSIAGKFADFDAEFAEWKPELESYLKLSADAEDPARTNEARRAADMKG